jgi:hypothetical protein
MVQIKRLLVGKHKQKGAVLVLTLVMLAVTLAIIPALVSLMVTGAKTGTMYEQKNNELYAADAGVQDAINRIKHIDPDEIAANPLGYSLFYDFGEEYGGDINGKIEQVTISTAVKSAGDSILYFKIFSQGQSYSGEETTITAYINAFSGWLTSKNAYTSPEYLALHPGDLIHGGAHIPGGWNKKGTLEDPPEPNLEPIVGWPSVSFFSNYYLQQVNPVENLIPGGTVIKVPQDSFPPGDVYCDGDLTIDFNNGDNNVSLGGTWYIKGKLTINRPASQGQAIVDLNGQSIFIEEPYNPEPGHEDDLAFDQDTLSGKAQVSISGPGAIVAAGNIQFAPSANTISSPIFIFSIEGYVDMWPRGDFYGSIASFQASKIQPNTRIFWPDDYDWGALNLPIMSEYTFAIGNIEAWEIDNPHSGVRIGPYSLPFAEIDQPYDQTLQATPTATYVWSVSSSILPDGMTLSSDGIIGGAPTITGKYYFTVEAADQSSGAIGKQVIVITIKPPPSIVLNLPENVAVGELYDGHIVIQGGVPPYVWKIDGTLPAGLKFNETTGQILGTPTESGTFPLTVTVTDGYSVSVSESFSIIIISP